MIRSGDISLMRSRASEPGSNVLGTLGSDRRGALLGGADDSTFERARVALIAHLLVVVGILCAVSSSVVFQARPEVTIPVYSLSLLAVIIWIAVSWLYVNRTLFDVYGMFVAMAFLFHGSFAILWSINRLDAIYLLPEISASVLANSLAAVLGGIAAVHLGALWASSVRPVPRVDVASDDGRASGYWLALGLCFIVIGLPPTLLDMKQGLDLVSVGGYRELFTSQGHTGAISVFRNVARDLLFTGACFLMISGRRYKASLVLSIGVITLIAGYNLYVGHRAYAILPVVASAWLWHNTIRPLPLRLLSIPVGLAVLYLMPIVRLLRGNVGSGRLSLDQFGDAGQSLPEAFVSLLGEAGGSLMTIAYTIELTPASRSFELGMTYVNAVANAIPMLNVPQPYGYGSEWLATTIKPEWAANGFGFGYSFLAEAYLNFGWLGVPVVAVMVGYLLASLIRWARGDAARHVVIAVFIPIVLFYVRGESVDVVRPFLWRAVLPYLALAVVLQIVVSRRNSSHAIVKGSREGVE